MTKPQLDQLETLLSIGFNLKEISTRLHISEEELYSKAKEFGLMKDPLPNPMNKRKHHPPVYNNSRSPMGIADELHSTPDRILI